MIIKDKNKLKEKCSPVSVKEGEEIGVRLLHELRDSENGIGLAATQVDHHIRLVVMDLSDDGNEPRVFVNPSYKVLKNHNLFEFEEGCLSIPGFNETISRPDKIELKWQDISGKEHIDEPEGLLTVCIQHEIDHLDGKLFVDYLSSVKRQRIRKKLKKNRA